MKGIIVVVALVCLVGAILFGVQVDVTKTCPYCGGDGTITSKVTCDTCGGDGKVMCTACGGDGKIAYGLLTCPTCGGTGQVTCSDCGGRGYKMVRKTCSHCNGRGYITYKVPLIEALIDEYT
ncbi:hypothetical protein C5S30_05035 [ANME-1 cluster archaeon GoMg4]|nr:hypothetical protein [ANME-1 cluster archaeon GoMg4]